MIRSWGPDIDRKAASRYRWRMKEKRLHRFEQGWMASAVRDELRRNGIEARMEFRPREYTSILLGGVQDGADLFVDHRDYISAKRIVDSFHARDEGAPDEEILSAAAPRNYGKRVIIFSLLGFLLPVVFNLFATMNFLRMSRRDASPGWWTFVFLVLIGGWIFAVSLLLAGFVTRGIL